MGGHTHEPLSFPAGYIFVPASLILAAQNEAEFAGMLAHAMAHIADRHGTRMVTRGQLVNGASVPIVLGSFGGWTTVENGDREPASPMAFLTIRRHCEMEADRLAVKMTSGVRRAGDCKRRFTKWKHEALWPPMNADKRRLQSKCLIGVYRRSSAASKGISRI